VIERSAGLPAAAVPPVEIPESMIRTMIEAFPEAPLSIVGVDLDGTVTIWNHFAEILYGWEEHDAIGAPIESLLVGPVQMEEAGSIKRQVREGGHWGGTFEARRADGEFVTVSIMDIPVVDDHGNPCGAVALSREYSGQLQASLAELASLRELALHLDEVRRDEQRRIAGQFHDEFSQRLHRLIQMTAQVQECDQLSPQLMEHVAKLLELEAELSETMQGMWGSLRPPLLDDFGVKAALEHVLLAMTPLIPQLTFDDIDERVDEISPEIGEALVGVVQESLANVLKHSSATECTVEIGVDDETVSATIRDNGHGDLGEEGFGLRLMRERVRRFGGALSIEAIPAEGIVVRVRLPLTSETEA